MTCEICASDTRQLFVAHGFWVRGCVKCGHRLADVNLSNDHTKTVFDDRYFFGGEAGYVNYASEAEMLRWRGRWYAALIQKFAKPGSVLDVGAAAGFLLQGFQDCGFIGCGLEPNASQAEFARTNLGLNVQTTSLEKFKSDQTFDLVSMIQVIAHFADMRKSLQVTSDVSHSGSLLLIESWNWRSWTARVFGKSWHEYSPPTVLRWFSPGELIALARQFGFQKIAQGRPPKSIAGSHAKSLLQYKLREVPLGLALCKITAFIPDNVQIPYPSEDLFWMLLRKQ